MSAITLAPLHRCSLVLACTSAWLWYAASPLPGVCVTSPHGHAAAKLMARGLSVRDAVALAGVISQRISRLWKQAKGRFPLL